MDNIDETLSRLEQAFYSGLESVNSSHRVAILDVLSLLAGADAFHPIIFQTIAGLRQAYFFGSAEEKAHVEYILKFILTDTHANSSAKSTYNSST